MKIIIRFALLIFILTFQYSTADAYCLATDKMESRPPKIHIYVDYGRPPGCGWINGICSISTSGEPDKIYNYPKAGVYCTYENGMLIMDVEESEMSDRLNIELGSIKSIIVDDPISLSPETIRILLAPANASIQLGNYPISKIETGYRISFILK